jgi:hypothetical protein
MYWRGFVMSSQTTNVVLPPLRVISLNMTKMLLWQLVNCLLDLSANAIKCDLYLLTNWLTLWSWALLERPLDSFPAFHGTRKFNTEFTRALHLLLSRARPIQSTSPHPTSPRSILILSTHLRLGLPRIYIYWFSIWPYHSSLSHSIHIVIFTVSFNSSVYLYFTSQ